MATSYERSVCPARRVAGSVRVPGDKSITHRALMLAALADGASRIANLAPGEDCRATMSCLQALGVRMTPVPAADDDTGPGLVVDGRGVGGLAEATQALDARNSGTTARLLMGLLSAHGFTTTLTGDESLRQRPMGRVVTPLAQMGARIATADGRLPALITGGALRGVDYRLPVASAQVKSAILLAGLHAAGTTVVREPAPTRDHTELALRAFGVRVESGPDGVSIEGGQHLAATRVDIPGDPSSAAFWAAGAAALPGSSIEVSGVGLNPTRIAFLGVLRRFGATVETDPWNAGEPEARGVMRVAHRAVGSVVVEPAEVPALIDELPVLAALATHGGQFAVTGAAELRVKESDRIAALARGLRAMGAVVDEFADGFHIDGRRPLAGGTVDASGDHRLAMAFAIAALGATGPTTIMGADVVSVSYPGFFDVLDRVCV